MKEEWKVIEDNTNYEISNAGIVRNVSTGHVMHQEDNTAGYLRVSLGCPQKKFFVHHLVAKAFVDGYFDGAVVNHKDFNKHNNTADNLEWCSRSYNSKHAYIGGHQEGSFKEQLRTILYKGKVYKDTTIREFCKLQGICKSSFFNYVKAGKISYVSNDYCESKYTEACGNGENSESC